MASFKQENAVNRKMPTPSTPRAENGLVAKSLAILFLSLCWFGLSSFPSRASVLSEAAVQMKSGEWREIATNGFNNGAILTPPGGSGSILEYTDEAQRNPFTRKIYIIGCARSGGGSGTYICSTTGSEDAKWVEYDENTNTWRVMPTGTVSPNVGYHTYDHAALDATNGDYYFREVGSAKVWHYRAGEWTRIPDMPNSSSCCGALEYFPELGGIVFADSRNGGGQFYLYKSGASGWQTLPGGIAFANYHYITEYSPKYKTLFIGGGIGAPRTVLKMDATGEVSRIADPPVDLGIEVAVHTTDPITGNLVVFSRDGKTYDYDPAADAWRQAGTHSLVGTYGALQAVATPLAELGVIFMVWEDCSNCGKKVFLYKHSPGTVSPPPPDITPPAKPIGVTVK